MRAAGFRRFVRVVTLIALVAGSLSLGSTAARADDFSPELLSFTRTGTGLLGGEQLVSIEFSARDEGPAGLAYAYFTFSAPQGDFLRVDSEWMGRAAEGTFSATKLLSPWIASGTYRLEKIEVSDREWNTTTYERATSSQFDFAAADFTVDNPNQDTTVPTLSSATLFQENVAQGTPVVILYTATDDLSGVEEVVFSGWSPTGQQYYVRSLPQLGAAGPAAWVVPLQAASGPYDSFEIHVSDRAGNRILYRPAGEKYAYPPKASIPTHEHPDPETLGFTIEGGVGDRASPQMDSFSVLTPNVRHRGDLVALDFSAFDAGTGIEQVAAAWTDGQGHQIDANKTCGDLTRGPVSVEIEDYRSTGTRWELQYVVFADYLFNQTTYHRDGRITYQGGDEGAATHGFDLTQGDFDLEEGSPSPHDYPNTSRDYCFRNGRVSLDVPDTDVLFGDVVPITGIVDAPDNPVPEPIVAVHSHIDGEPDLLGVVEGDASGRYSKSLTANQNINVTATFLGAAGPAGADPSTSAKIPIRVRPLIDAVPSSKRVRLGRVLRLTGSVTPTDAGARLRLQRRFANGWRTIREGAVDAEGTFAFSLKPKRTGTLRLRVKTRATKTLAPGVTQERVVKVVRGS